MSLIIDKIMIGLIYYKKLLRNYLHIKFMTLKIDLKGKLSFYV